MSYTIDDLKPGMAESFSKTVSEHDIALFGEVSGDTNPVHFDDTFAKNTIFKGRIAHGVLSASYISTVLGMKMPGPGTIFLSLTTRFKAPVRPGDTLATRWTVVQKLDKPKHAGGIVVMKCEAKNQHGDVTVEADGKILVADRPVT